MEPVKEIFLDGRVIKENVVPSGASQTTRSLINLVNLKEYIVSVIEEANNSGGDTNFANQNLEFDDNREHDALSKSLEIDNLKELKLLGDEESEFTIASTSSSERTKGEVESTKDEIEVKFTNTDINSISKLSVSNDETALSNAKKVAFRNNAGDSLFEADSITKELTAEAYPHTRNDVADFAPINFLYTNSDKKILSAPISQIPGANTTLNNYSCIGESILYNPSASQVTSGTADLTLPTDSKVAFVTINGQVIPSSEYSQTGTDLSLTPVNGFKGTTDEILVFQHSFTQSSLGTSIVNYYSVIGAPTLLNPDAAGVIASSQVFQLNSSGSIALVTINGQTIDDSEYSLSGLTFTITPDNGFNSIGDEILVYQNTLSVNSEGGLKLSFRQIDAVYTVIQSDYFIEIINNSFTVSMFAANGNQGQVIEFRNTGGGVATIAPVSGETIDGLATIAIASGEAKKLISTGTVWITI